jgi:HAD superfamily hydrolase (TIGR01509 family)
MTIRHVIFDCDGVLVDSEPLSMRVDMALLAEHGVAITEEDAHRRFVGLTFKAMITMMEAESGRNLPRGIGAEKDRRLLDLYRQELRPVEGVDAVLGHLAGRTSIASNSPQARVAAALDLTGLTRYFAGRITTFEHVQRGKPEPDIFIEAARRAGFDPKHCLVIEDSATGVTAAVRAGCRVLGFTGTHLNRGDHGARLKAIGAEGIFHHMRDLPGFLRQWRVPGFESL